MLVALIDKRVALLGQIARKCNVKMQACVTVSVTYDLVMTSLCWLHALPKTGYVIQHQTRSY